jgi:N-acetylglucosamine-1-phosphodiester alpha-N-acetylglucosaminidase
VQDASLFSIELPPNGCADHRAVSAVVDLFNCQLATNGGFFGFTPPVCEYNLITPSAVVQYPDAGTVNMGLSSDFQQVIIGYVNASTYEAFHFSSLLSGQGWLVRDGAMYVNSSREFHGHAGSNSFVTEKAPRTAIGVTQDGTVLVFVVDGIETEKAGLSLYETAEVLMELGGWHVINVDGGGSSDAVLDGKIWSRPTCEDTPTPICERNVTSITCIKYAK